MLFRRLLTFVAALTPLPSALALVVPLPGWIPIAGDAAQWQDAAGNCLIRENRYEQAFAQLPSQQAALALSNRLRAALTKQGLGGVVTQPVERQNGWQVLAAYDYLENGVSYRVSQLFISQSGILKTVSGSSAVTNKAECAALMRGFIRYQAN